MPYTDRTNAIDMMKAWWRATPSQVTDAFHKVVNGKIERILAYEFPTDDLLNIIPKKLIQKSETEVDDIDYNLTFFYGYGADEGANQSAYFKIFAAVAPKGEAPQSYYELNPLSHTTLKKYLQKHASTSRASDQFEPINVEVQNVTNELIPPIMEQFFTYAWQACPTSQLIDQIEVIHKKKRKRIERSIYDGQVCDLLGKLHCDYNTNLLTLVYLGIHQVIPQSSRIFPFGPVLQSYIPGAVSDADSADEYPTSVERPGEDDPMHPVNFELSYPCPPACEPPDGDL